MARYFFQVDYHGAMITDDVGEEFATVQRPKLIPASSLTN
jgi:hypothetical protein